MKIAGNSSTIRDVARLAGVSVATVSRHVNGTAALNPETARRVQAAMDELDFSPHPAARSLATRRTHTIGLVLNKIEGDYFTPLLEGVVSVSEANDHNLLIFTSQHKTLDARLLSPAHTDGLLVFLNSLSDEDINTLNQAGQPMVLIHRSSPAGLTLPTVNIENVASAQTLVRHLIEVHGRERIAFLRGPKNNEDARARETGYRQALANANLPLDESLIAAGGYSRFIAQQSIQKLLALGKTFDAVFAADDDSALGAMTALKEAGIDVPGQVSVVGFDDQRFAPFLNPPLTTVHAPTEMVGRAAAEALLAEIRGEFTQNETLLPTEMILRRSCGCGG